MDLIRSLAMRSKSADIAIFHQYQRPPYGGGNQFLLALRKELEGRGLRVENNTISHVTKACLFNSFNFDFDRLRRLRRRDCRMVHRVDGPIGAYRGTDDEVDQRIHAINQELADATVFQSIYSLEQHQQLGLSFKQPTVVVNSVDSTIFYPPTHAKSLGTAKVRLISSAWSDNPRKGAATYQWLDEHLDFSRFDYTFVGRIGVPLRHIKTIAPLPSEQLAELLRQHDLYITASLNDPCSNALIEALACGLPALYADSGGHPELVQQAGFGFSSPQEIPTLLDQVVADYAARRAAIEVTPLSKVADAYLDVMDVS